MTVTTETVFADLDDHTQRRVRYLIDAGLTDIDALARVGAFRERRTDPTVEDYRRRMKPPTGADIVRRTAEHEAAHAVVADALDGRVASITVRVHVPPDGQRGLTTWGAKDTPDDVRAAVAAASHVWLDRFRSGRFRSDGGGCGQDRRDLAGYGDHIDQAHAVRLATAVLHDNRAKVLDLADRLEAKANALGGCYLDLTGTTATWSPLD